MSDDVSDVAEPCGNESLEDGNQTNPFLVSGLPADGTRDVLCVDPS